MTAPILISPQAPARSVGGLSLHPVHGRALLALATIASFAVLVTSTRAQDPNQLDIGVRTQITDKSNLWAGKTAPTPGSGGHSRIYGILSVGQIESEYRLVRPVNEKMILQVLSEELNKNGFKLHTSGQQPEILITASYGRGELENPYIREGGETGGDARAGGFSFSNQAVDRSRFPATVGSVTRSMGGVSNDSGATTSVITGAFAQQLMDEKSPGYQAKIQKAAYEKLFIRITAWAYPTKNQDSPEMLWKTIIVVDDPDHRDLNAVAARMLEAGAPFFDKEINEPEAQIFKPLSDSRVNVGTPEVISPKSK